MPAMQPQERPGGRVYGGGPGYGDQTGPCSAPTSGGPGYAEPTSGGAVYGGPTSGGPSYGAPGQGYGGQPAGGGPMYGGGGGRPTRGRPGAPPARRDPLMLGAMAIGVIGVILGILFATGVFAGDNPPPPPPPASAPASPAPTAGG